MRSEMRARRAPSVVASADSDAPPATKITIRKPGGAAAGAADTTDASATKVSVRVRAPSERKAAQVVAAPVAEEDDDVMTTVSIKAPEKVEQPPSPASTELGEAEQKLLEATQKANTSRVLTALQMGANPNVRDPSGRTPLHFMSGVGLAPACVLLIHYGAQIDVADSGGLTPMHMAAGYANAQTLKVLVAAGADDTIAAPNQGTPIDVVCALGDYQLSEIYQKRKGLDRFKKKDEKLDKLKACMDVLDDPETVRQEADWDQMLTEVLKAINPPTGDEPEPAEA